MRLLGPHRVVVRRNHVAREGPLRPVGGRRQGQGRFRRPRHEQVGLGLLDDLLDVHHADRDGAVRARLHARGGFAFHEPVAAHVALADDALGAAVLGRLVGTGQRAVLAPEALVIEVLDDARDRVLLVGLHRAGVHAGRVEAVVAGGRHVLDDRQAPAAAVQQADVAPRLFVLEAVEPVTGCDARLAPRAGVQIHVEGVLLAGGRRRRRHERRVASGQGRSCIVGPRGVVRLREASRRPSSCCSLQVAVDEGRCRSHHSHPARASRGATWNCSGCTRSAGTPACRSHTPLPSMKVEGPHRK